MNPDQGLVKQKPGLAELQLKMCCHFFILRAEEHFGVISEANEDRLFLDLSDESFLEIARRSELVTTWDELVAGL